MSKRSDHQEEYHKRSKYVRVSFTVAFLSSISFSIFSRGNLFSADTFCKTRSPSKRFFHNAQPASYIKVYMEVRMGGGFI